MTRDDVIQAVASAVAQLPSNTVAGVVAETAVDAIFTLLAQHQGDANYADTLNLLNPPGQASDLSANI
jgi:hypothetical protein